MHGGDGYNLNEHVDIPWCGKDSPRHKSYMRTIGAISMKVPILKETILFWYDRRFVMRGGGLEKHKRRSRLKRHFATIVL